MRSYATLALALGVHKSRAPNIEGSIVTEGGLVFMPKTIDHRFRVFDAKTGELLFATCALPAGGAR